MFGLALAIAGCGPEPREPQTSGGPPRAPLRIVSLAPALTETVFALGLGDRVVGVTRFCDYPPETRAKAKVGGYVDPSVEAVLALRPDLVLVSPSAGNRQAASALERAGVRLAVVRAERLEDTYAAIEVTARACGVDDRGRDLARRIREDVRAAALESSRGPAVRALLCLQLDPIIAAGPGTLPAEILELAGGHNIVREPGYPRLGIESVIEMAPEVILQPRMDTADEREQERALSYWARWRSIPAVRDGRVRVFEGGRALRPGPRIAEAVREISGLLRSDPRASEHGAP
jgi:iron complex transport system substrate-binding protein